MVETAARAFGTRDTRGAVERVVDATTDTGLNAIGWRLGNLAEGAIGGAGRAARNLADFTEAGIRPTAGGIFGSTTQMLEKGLSNTLGGGPIRRAAQEQAGQLRGAVDRLASSIAEPLDATAGGARARELALLAVQRAELVAEQQYGRAFTLIGPDTRTALPNVTQYAADLRASIEANPETAAGIYGPALAQAERLIADAGRTVGRTALNPDGYTGITFQGLREARTAIGRIVDAPPAAGSEPQTIQALRGLYATLTADMKGAALAISPEARRLITEADAQYARYAREFAPTLQRVMDAGNDEQAWRLIENWSRGSASELAKLRSSVSREEWGTISGSILARLGQARPATATAQEIGSEAGATFSPQAFLTEWEKIARNGPALSILFARTENGALPQKLNQLVRVMNNLRDVERMGNPSGTARNVASYGAVGWLGNHLMRGDLDSFARDAIALGIAPNIISRAMTNPAFVGMLAQLGEVAGRTPARLPSMGARVAAVGAANPELRDLVEVMRQGLAPEPAER